MSQHEEIAKAFIAHYYNAFDNNVDQLAGLFTDQTMMTFEGTQLQGTHSVMEKLKSFGKVLHKVKSIDVQPSHSPSAIVIFVTGSINIGSENPLHFCEFFQLVSSGPNQYYVSNDVFRLNYGL